MVGPKSLFKLINSNIRQIIPNSIACFHQEYEMTYKNDTLCKWGNDFKKQCLY